MVRNWKSVSVGASLALGILALGGYAYTRIHSDIRAPADTHAPADAARTYRMANGVEVLPVDVPPDDVAKVLEVKTWKFAVAQAGVPKPLYVSLVQCRNGALVKALVGSFGPGPVKHAQVSFSLCPVGDTFFGAKQLKYCLSSKEGLSSTGTIPNIFLGGHVGYTSDAQPAGNLVILMSTNKSKAYLSGSSATNDTGLALSFSQTPQ